MGGLTTSPTQDTLRGLYLATRQEQMEGHTSYAQIKKAFEEAHLPLLSWLLEH